MTRLLAVWRSPIFRSGLLALVLVLLIWFVGPLIAIADVKILESERIRFLVIVVVLALWGLNNLRVRLHEKNSNNRMVSALTHNAAAGSEAAGDAGDAPEVGRAELDVVRHDLMRALEVLRGLRFGEETGGGRRRALYQLPWYVVIGPPGSGKTTLLANAGLSLPLADHLGVGPIAGAGGTRNCDWWFTDEAVLIDTAGRYTTQDSRPEVDSQVWQGFLDLLKLHRPRQPLNGALIVISLPELAALDETERVSHARIIKTRLTELNQRLDSRLPIYVLFTKVDRIDGFGEAFDGLNRDHRRQVWGLTLPLEGHTEHPGVVAGFGAGFEALVAQLGRWMLARLVEQADETQVSRGLAFSGHVALLRPAAEDFLNTVFAPNRYDPLLVLRGVYLTSATQGSPPIDLLRPRIAPVFGLAETAGSPAGDDGSSGSLGGGTGGGGGGPVRPFFLTNLLREVVFAEANLGALEDGEERRQTLIRRAAMAGIAALTLLICVTWATSWWTNWRLIDTVAGQAERASAGLRTLGPPTADPEELRQLVPLLQALRTAWEDQAADFGLSPAGRIGESRTTAYRTALNRFLLPRLMIPVENRIRSSLSDVDTLFETLKIYLMLTGRGPLEAPLVSEWVARALAQALPEAGDQPVRDALATDTAALLAFGPETKAADETLISQARAGLAQYPWAARGYARLRALPAVRDLPDWRVADHAGPAAAKVLVRASGKTIWDGMPGLYAYDPFYQAVLPGTVDVAKSMASYGWVVGRPSDPASVSRQVSTLASDILGLYYDDYQRQWDTLLADVRVAPFTTVTQAADMLNALTGGKSPLRLFLTAAADETALLPNPADRLAATAKAANAPFDLNAMLASQPALALVVNLTKTVLAAMGPPPGTAVTQHFKSLRDSVISPNGPSALDQVIAAYADLYQVVSRAAVNPERADALMSSLFSGVANPGAPPSPLDRVKQISATMPAAVGALVAGVATQGDNLAAGGARTQLNAAWRAAIVPLCDETLDGRYPLVPTAPIEVSPDDFTRMFAPGGEMDKFFATYLKPYVDTSVRPWRWVLPEDAASADDPVDLDPFELTADIRAAFFPPGSPTPKLSFTLEPLELDARVDRMTLDIEGQVLTFSHEPPKGRSIVWPSPEGAKRIRLSMSPAPPGEAEAVNWDGPWDLFHMMSASRLIATKEADQFRLEVAVGSRKATFTLKTSSANNPFVLFNMEMFSCPPKL